MSRAIMVLTIGFITWLAIVMAGNSQSPVTQDWYYETSPFAGLQHAIAFSVPSSNATTFAAITSDPVQLAIYQSNPLSSLTITGGYLCVIPPMGTSNIVQVIDRSVDPAYVNSYNQEWYIINTLSNYGDINVPLDTNTMWGAFTATISAQSTSLSTTMNQSLSQDQIAANQLTTIMNTTGVNTDEIGVMVAFQQIQGDKNVKWDGAQFITNVVSTVKYPLWGNQ